METPAVGPERFELVRLASGPADPEVFMASAAGAPDALALAVRLAYTTRGAVAPIAADRILPDGAGTRRMYLALVDHDARDDAETAAVNLRDVLGFIAEDLAKMDGVSGPRLAAIVASARGSLATAEEALGRIVAALDDAVRSELDDGDVIATGGAGEDVDAGGSGGGGGR